MGIRLREANPSKPFRLNESFLLVVERLFRDMTRQQRKGYRERTGGGCRIPDRPPPSLMIRHSAVRQGWGLAMFETKGSGVQAEGGAPAPLSKLADLPGQISDNVALNVAPSKPAQGPLSARLKKISGDHQWARVAKRALESKQAKEPLILENLWRMASSFLVSCVRIMSAVQGSRDLWLMDPVNLGNVGISETAAAAAVAAAESGQTPSDEFSANDSLTNLPQDAVDLAQLLHFQRHDGTAHAEIIRAVASFVAQDDSQFVRAMTGVMNSSKKDEPIPGTVLRGLLAAFHGSVSDSASVNRLFDLCQVPPDIGAALIAIAAPPNPRAITMAAAVLEPTLQLPAKVIDTVVAVCHRQANEASMAVLSQVFNMEAAVLAGMFNLVSSLYFQVSGKDVLGPVPLSSLSSVAAAVVPMVVVVCVDPMAGSQGEACLLKSAQQMPWRCNHCSSPWRRLV